jgi:hypothetical protein
MKELKDIVMGMEEKTSRESCLARRGTTSTGLEWVCMAVTAQTYSAGFVSHGELEA